MGIFFNAGQVCAAGSRLYVHRSLHEQVLARLCEIAGSMKVGPGDDPSAQIGPLISEKHRNRVHGYVSSGREDGAELLVGGGAPDRAGWFYQPTILAGARSDTRVVREEIFGPVLVANAFDDIDEVVAQANDSIYGLTATVWTRDLSAAHRLARRLHAGTIRINVGGGNDPNLPFGGFKQSGWGREFGEDGLDLYLQNKSVVAAI
jgi:acyl-CoA reductase-like NAD-dependent aldehyde dehydrogenase